LVQTAERTLSEMRVTGLGSASALCVRGNCLTELAATLLPERCGSLGCATPEPKTSAAVATANDTASIQVSTIITNEFDALTKRPMRPAIPWAEWTERSAFGGLYKPSYQIHSIENLVLPKPLQTMQ
jgi:hypothetical protein